MLQRSRFIFSLLLIITCGCTPTTNISSDLQEQLCDTTVKDINNSLEMKLSDFCQTHSDKEILFMLMSGIIQNRK